MDIYTRITTCFSNYTKDESKVVSVGEEMTGGSVSKSEIGGLSGNLSGVGEDVPRLFL